jgi:hypothetical protein
MMHPRYKTYSLGESPHYLVRLGDFVGYDMRFPAEMIGW